MAERLLLIEDDEQLSAMLHEYLGMHGMEVVARPTAMAGLALLRQSDFAALVLEPSAGGLEAGRWPPRGGPVALWLVTAAGAALRSSCVHGHKQGCGAMVLPRWARSPDAWASC